uniref:ubiquitinyl hydrolase 1 n=1 Tax=Trichogramma kaykai TaxID=54128 RepID=A0ABD2X2B4_9HYME
MRACLQALKSNDQEISTLKNCFQQSLKAIDNAGNVSSYASREQQDCTEFFQSLLCHFKEVYGASDRQNRFLDELFTVTLKKSLLCSKCYHCTNNGISLEEDHNVMFLSMDNDHTQENINLTDLLFKIKNNEREQECSKCLKSTTHIINTCISKYPKFVLLALNRFSVNNNKICQPVYVPDCLDLNFLKFTDVSLSTNYKLRSFICHHGESIEEGHYTAFTKVHDNWHHADDNSVNKNINKRVRRNLPLFLSQTHVIRARDSWQVKSYRR